MDDIKNKILYLKDVQNLSLRQIAQQSNLSRQCVSRIYSGTWQEIQPRGFLLDAYRDLIAQWFADCKSLKAIQVYQRLQERGVPVGQRTVSRYTQGFRRKKYKTYLPLSFLPGEEGQVDWFFVNHPHLGKLCGFALILSYSRYLFAHLFPRSSFEFFIEGHLMAFSSFGGCPHALRYDNLKSVVLKKQPLQYNPSFLDFARHYSFEIRLCNLAAGNEKGRVERVIRSLRETFFNTQEHHLSLKALNQALHEWVEQKNHILHRATQKIPVEAKKEELLKALPERPWDNIIIHAPKRSTKTGLILFDTNSYSIPDYLTGQLLSLHVRVDHIDIYTLNHQRVASHPRSFERYCQILNPSHRSCRTLSQAAKRERIYALIKNMAPEIERFLARTEQGGDDPYQCAYQLFKLLKTTARATLLSAIRESLVQTVVKMSYVHSLLQQQPPHSHEFVSPQNKHLLNIDYKERTLEAYDDINS